MPGIAFLKKSSAHSKVKRSNAVALKFANLSSGGVGNPTPNPNRRAFASGHGVGEGRACKLRSLGFDFRPLTLVATTSSPERNITTGCAWRNFVCGLL